MTTSDQTLAPEKSVVADDLDTSGGQLSEAETCDACAHPEASHDAIARRYCRATITSAATRTCICSV